MTTEFQTHYSHLEAPFYPRVLSLTVPSFCPLLIPLPKKLPHVFLYPWAQFIFLIEVVYLLIWLFPVLTGKGPCLFCSPMWILLCLQLISCYTFLCPTPATLVSLPFFRHARLAYAPGPLHLLGFLSRKVFMFLFLFYVLFWFCSDILMADCHFLYILTQSHLFHEDFSGPSVLHCTCPLPCPNISHCLSLLYFSPLYLPPPTIWHILLIYLSVSPTRVNTPWVSVLCFLFFPCCVSRILGIVLGTRALSKCLLERILAWIMYALWRAQSGHSTHFPVVVRYT